MRTDPQLERVRVPVDGQPVRTVGYERIARRGGQRVVREWVAARANLPQSTPRVVQRPRRGYVRHRVTREVQDPQVGHERPVHDVARLPERGHLRGLVGEVQPLQRRERRRGGGLVAETKKRGRRSVALEVEGDESRETREVSQRGCIQRVVPEVELH